MDECEYCKNKSKEFLINPCGNGDLEARAHLIDNGIVLFINKHTAAGYFDIKFCPMCGKKLVGGD